jgi:hypothetical protein
VNLTILLQRKITDNSLALERERSLYPGITTQSYEVDSSKYYNLGFYRTADPLKPTTGLPTVHVIRSTISTTAVNRKR